MMPERYASEAVTVGDGDGGAVPAVRLNDAYAVSGAIMLPAPDLQIRDFPGKQRCAAALAGQTLHRSTT